MTANRPQRKEFEGQILRILYMHNLSIGWQKQYKNNVFEVQTPYMQRKFIQYV